MKFLTLTLAIAVALLLPSTNRTFAAGNLPPCEESNSTFDYVVIGAGAGGGPLASRLLLNPLSWTHKSATVLVVDAGHDVLNLNTTIPLYFIRAIEDLQTELNYTLDEYPPGFQFQKNDAWYPRARAVGGSTIHNAMINIIAETKTDFDNLAAAFNDSTWSRDNMQNYFKRIEHNLYTLGLDPVNHGYGGWLSTNLNPDLTVLNPMFLGILH
ncbi:hypothetical protein GGU10DRAFT_262652 [Lentinula aff. detonsa]|uniref:Glucose-methanol-choline oxidoreductase N-terminal domain-containing protein n=1 Tax=Lentinula aff. detonsa TaxID=2804958 RepID=A0AA38KGL4_9AGAR|nr:hypothetical protein GGU10DRAFT_262652 [Lentinula aff. detonsa]